MVQLEVRSRDDLYQKQRLASHYVWTCRNPPLSTCIKTYIKSWVYHEKTNITHHMLSAVISSLRLQRLVRCVRFLNRIPVWSSNTLLSRLSVTLLESSPEGSRIEGFVNNSADITIGDIFARCGPISQIVLDLGNVKLMAPEFMAEMRAKGCHAENWREVLHGDTEPGRLIANHLSHCRTTRSWA